MRQNPENPEFPEDFDDFAEESPIVVETADEEREVDEHPGDNDHERLRERRSLGSDVADDADAVEQNRVVELDEDEYR